MGTLPTLANVYHTRILDEFSSAHTRMLQSHQWDLARQCAERACPYELRANMTCDATDCLISKGLSVIAGVLRANDAGERYFPNSDPRRRGVEIG